MKIPTLPILDNWQDTFKRWSREFYNIFDNLNDDGGYLDVSRTDSSVDALTGAVTTNEANISVNSDEIELRVIEGTIGGRNLIINSGFDIDGSDNWTETGTGWAFTSTGRVGGVCASVSGALATTKYIDQTISFNNITGNCVVSCYAKSSSVSLGSTNPFVRLYASVQDGGGSWHYFNNGADIVGTTAWTRYSVVIDPSGWANPTIAVIKVHGYARDFTGTIYYDDFQLEEGSSLTAWTSSAEESDIRENSAQITVNADNISLKASQTEVDSIDGRLTTAESEISVNATAIDLRVVEGTIGGGNFIVNGSWDIDDGDEWTESGATWSYASTGRTGGVCASITGALTTTKYLKQTVDLNATTTPLVLSGFVKTTSVVHGTTNPVVAVYAQVVDGASTVHYVNGGNISGTNPWTRYWCVIDPSGWTNKTIDYVEVFAFVRDVTGTVYFDDFQLEEGEEPTSWKNNANEMHNSSMTLTARRASFNTEIFEWILRNSSDPNAARCEIVNGNFGVEFLFYDDSDNIASKMAVTKEARTVGGGNPITVGSGGDYSGINVAFSALPKTIVHTTAVVIDGGTYNEDVILTGFNGQGDLYLEAKSGETVNIKSIHVDSCQCRVYLKDVNITGYQWYGTGILATRSSVVHCENVSMTTSNTLYYGITYIYSNGTIYNCTVSNRSVGMEIIRDSQVEIESCSGTGNTTGIEVSSAIIHDRGSNTITGTTPFTTPVGGIYVPPTGIGYMTSWTPTLYGGTTAGSFTYTNREGIIRYIAGSAFIDCRIRIASVVSAGSGEIRVSGFPVSNALSFPATGVGGALSKTKFNGTYVSAMVLAGASEATLYGVTDNATLSTSDISTITANSYIYFSVNFPI